MRSLGEGYTYAKRFCGLMNMPSPVSSTAYRASNIELFQAAKKVVSTTMGNAANEMTKDPAKDIN